ncbi:MAG: voltage-gated ClC-type chloride channel ClcB [Roseateles sp.]|nr:MAG: voltage-gated ClC-type chloride channel ClcB [Roseateles sp.]
MPLLPLRAALRALRAPLLRLDRPWRQLVVAACAGVLGALAVSAFKALLFALEHALVHAHGGHLVAAAQSLSPLMRVATPAVGGLAAGLLLAWAQRRAPRPAAAHGGDYIEAVVIGRGRLDLRAGLYKVGASLLVVCTGGAIGREGAMVLLAAMLASLTGRLLGPGVDLRLLVSCGAAAGLAAAYHAPLAAAVFVAEILLGSLALAQLGPVLVAAVMAFGVSMSLGERAVLFPVPPLGPPDALQAGLLLLLSLLGGTLGAGLQRGLRHARKGFVATGLPRPLAFALGGLIVGLLSLWRPEVWGNGYSSIQQQLVSPAAWQLIALVLLLKLLAIGASTGSGAPGGVFTPTLFVGAALGALAGAALTGLGSAPGSAAVYPLVGMAVLLAATTHAPVMSALMVFEMCGQYALLPMLLPACVLATLVASRLEPVSIYGLRGPGDAAPGRG